MNITFRQLKIAEPILRRLLNSDLETKVSLSLRRFVKAVNADLECYEAERRKLVEKFAEKDSSGKVLVDESNNAKFQSVEAAKSFLRAGDELLDSECEVAIPRFSPDVLCGLHGFEKIKPVEAACLDPFLEEE